MKKKLKEYLLKLILIIPIAYFSLLFIIFIFQRNLLYHPKENNYFGDELKVKIEKVKIETGDNFELLGWFHEKDLRNFKTIVFFHGNAGTLENRIHKINHFKEMNINFLIISWRGFSGNLGKPSEKGLYEDGESAINWLKGKGLKDNDIVLYGESLGTGIATHVAQKRMNLQGLYWNLHLHLWLMQQKMCIHIFQSDFYLKTNTKVIKKLKILSLQF